MGMLSNPGGAACQFTFGDGITEFKSKTWASIDAHGDDSLGPIAYRADGKRLFALPAKGIEIMGFDVVNPNRIEVFNLAGCALTRVTSTTTTTQSGLPNRAPSASAAGAPPPAPGPAKSSTASKVAAVAPVAGSFNVVAPVTRSLSPDLARQTRRCRRQPGAGDVGRALQGTRDRRQGAEHEQPAHRPARQRLRRPAPQGDAVRLRRQ